MTAAVNTITTDDLTKYDRPYMKFFVDDFLHGVRTAGMSVEEIGIYALLLMYQWRTGRAIRDDEACIQDVRRWTGLNVRVIRRLLPKLIHDTSPQQKFKELPDGSGDFWNARVLREITAFVNKVRKNRPNDDVPVQHDVYSDYTPSTLGLHSEYTPSCEAKNPTNSMVGAKNQASTRARTQISDSRRDSNKNSDSQVGADSPQVADSVSCSGSFARAQEPESSSGPDDHMAAVPDARTDLPLSKAASKKSAKGVTKTGIAKACAGVWNEFAGKHGLSKVVVERLSDARIKACAARTLQWLPPIEGRPIEIEDYVNVFRETLSMCVGRAFLFGDNDRGWMMSFDFVIQAKSWSSIREGRYGNSQRVDSRVRQFRQQSTYIAPQINGITHDIRRVSVD